MKMRLSVLFSIVSLPTLVGLADVEAKQPNFVFFLVDDLGYMDIGANNPDTFYETPHVDALAKQSMRFTNGYAASPVCSPTRYSIMTGRHPSRVDATNFFAGRRPGKFRPAPLNDRMPLSEVTLGEAFASAGYRTAFLGKWHLGPNENYWPEKQGFPINIGGHVRGLPKSYFSPYSNPRLKDGPQGEHLTRRLTDETIKLIDRFKDDPFLIYLSFYTVHTPLQASRKLVAKYKEKAEALEGQPEFADEEQVWETKRERKVRILQKHATYAAMVESMDTSVGRVIDKLKEAGLYDDTVVCFLSDNGGLSTSEGSPTSNLPLRGGKGWVYEGGIREPFMIRWPGVTDGGKTNDTPVVSMDFYPTLLEIAGLEQRPQQHQDGVSLASLIKNDAALKRDALYWHYPHYSNQGGFPGGAIREGDWKLIERYEDGSTQLYNLAADMGERKDVSKMHAERVTSMKKKLHRWYEEVDAKMLRKKENGPEPWQP